jgi:hypothetical protein
MFSYDEQSSPDQVIEGLPTIWELGGSPNTTALWGAIVPARCRVSRCSFARSSF